MRPNLLWQRGCRAAPALAVTLAVMLSGGCGSAAPSSGGGSPSTTPPADASSAAPTPMTHASPGEATSVPGTVAPTPPGPVRTHWEQAGTLQLAYDDPHLLLLGDGRAMVVGTGTDDSMRGAVAPRQRSRLVEVWDPADGEWRKAEPLVRRAAAARR